jgi:hypothetical protein
MGNSKRRVPKPKGDSKRRMSHPASRRQMRWNHLHGEGFKQPSLLKRHAKQIGFKTATPSATSSPCSHQPKLWWREKETIGLKGSFSIKRWPFQGAYRKIHRLIFLCRLLPCLFCIFQYLINVTYEVPLTILSCRFLVGRCRSKIHEMKITLAVLIDLPACRTIKVEPCLIKSLPFLHWKVLPKLSNCSLKAWKLKA